MKCCIEFSQSVGGWSSRVSLGNWNAEGRRHTSQCGLLSRLLHHSSTLSDDHGICGTRQSGKYYAPMRLARQTKLFLVSVQLSYLRMVRQELGQPKARNANHPTGRLLTANSRTASLPRPQSVNYIELKASNHSNELESSASTNNSSSQHATSNGVGARLQKPSFAESKLTHEARKLLTIYFSLFPNYVLFC